MNAAALPASPSPFQDVAIAFGFNNIQKTLPRGATQGRQQPINQLSDLIRIEVRDMRHEMN